MEYIPAFEQAVKDVANNISPTESPVYVGFEGSFGDNMISPRNLDASHLGRTICVEAIVTRCMFLDLAFHVYSQSHSHFVGSLVRPKVARSVHYCEATQLFHARDYRDGMSLSNDAPTGSVYPKEVCYSSLSVESIHLSIHNPLCPVSSG